MAEQKKAVCGGFYIGEGLEMDRKVLSATGGSGECLIKKINYEIPPDGKLEYLIKEQDINPEDFINYIYYGTYNDERNIVITPYKSFINYETWEETIYVRVNTQPCVVKFDESKTYPVSLVPSNPDIVSSTYRVSQATLDATDFYAFENPFYVTFTFRGCDYPDNYNNEVDNLVKMVVEGKATISCNCATFKDSSDIYYSVANITCENTEYGVDIGGFAMNWNNKSTEWYNVRTTDFETI